MAVVFNRNDKFSGDRKYTRIRWGEDSSIVDSDLSELQKMIRYQMQTMGRHTYTNGFVNNTPLEYYQNGSTTDMFVKADTVVIDGEFIEFTQDMYINIPAGGAQVFFATWEQEIKLGDSVKKDGNLSGGSTLPSNGIDPDPIVGGENTRRYQRQIQLVTSSSDPNIRYIPVATFGSSNNLVSDDRPRASLVGYVPPDDSAEYGAVALTPGTQVVEGMNTSTFSLTGLKGGVLQNLLGSDGDFERENPSSSGTPLGWMSGPIGGVAMNSDSPSYGAYAVRIYSNSGDDNIENRYITRNGGTNFSVRNGAYYVAIVDVKTDGVGTARLRFADDMGSVGVTVADALGEETIFVKAQATKDSNSAFISLQNYSALGVVSWVQFDGARVYEVPKEVYDLIGTAITAENINQFLPFVNGTAGVKFPYITRYGQNLAYGFPNAFINGTDSRPRPIAQGAYEVTFSGESISTNVDKGVYFNIPVQPGQVYTSAVDTLADLGRIRYEYYNGNPQLGPDNWVKAPEFFPSDWTVTVTIPEGCYELRMYVTNQTTLYKDGNGALVNESIIGGTYHFKNWRLFLGDKDLGFTPREDATLALQTELWAAPNGANADTVFEKNGQYFKNKMWEQVSLDGTQSFGSSSKFTGYKVIRIMNSRGAWVNYSGVATKYNGKPLKMATVGGDWALNGADTLELSGDGSIYLSIANEDSGWGQDYTPSADDMRAYMLGWRMFLWGSAGNGVVPYNGTGTKGWGKRYANSNTLYDGTTTLPTTSAWSEGFAPYQLTYQLKTPVIEPITSEGCLTFHDGDNIVEVGSGLVVRESVSPKGSAVTGQTRVINYKYADIDTWLKYPLKEFVGVYKNGALDPAWEVKSAGTAQGNAFAQCFPEKYDESAAYSTTYKMLANNALASVFGTVDLNDKALLYSLADEVRTASETAKLALNTGQQYALTAPNGKGIRLPDGADLNKLMSSGVYSVWNPVNGPGLLDTGFLITVHEGATAGTGIRQVADHTSGASHARMFDGTKWSRWAPTVKSRYLVDSGENLVKNPAGYLGLTGWAPSGGNPANWASMSTAYGTSFVFVGPSHASAEGYLSVSTAISGWANSMYTLSADLLNENTLREGDIVVEVVATAGGQVLGSITSNAQGTWERRSVTFNTGSVTSFVLRIGVRRGLPSGLYYATNIMLNVGRSEAPFNDRSTSNLLFQQSVDVKTKVAGAVNGLGGTANAGMTGDELASAITGTKRLATGTASSSASGTTGTFITYAGITHNKPYIFLQPSGGFGFWPDFVLLIPNYPDAQNQVMAITTFNAGRKIGTTTAPIQVQDATGAFQSMYQLTSQATVSSSSIRLPVADHGVPYIWIAGKRL